MTQPPAPREGALALPEAAAREVMLARAIEESDPQHRLLAEAERDRIERDAVLATRDPARPHAPDPALYLPARAQAIVQALAARNPRIGRIGQSDPWQGWLAWVLPSAAFVTGAFIDRFGNPHQLDLLSPPLLLFLLWNVLIYVALVAAPLLPGGMSKHNPLQRAGHWLAWLPATWRERMAGNLRLAVEARFRDLWWRTGRAVEALRVQQVLHASAAAWAVGVALSIVVGGLVREYRVGWESTWLGPSQAHALLSAVTWPVVELLPVQGFTLDDVRRLHFRSGAAVGQGEARQWVMLYVGLLLLVVIVPRVVLALYCAWRKSRLARRLVVDMGDDYFAATLGRVSPARVRIAVVAPDPLLRQQLAVVLRQATVRPLDWQEDAAEAEVLRTEMEDELRVAAGADSRVDQVWLLAANEDQARAGLAALGRERPVLLLHPGSAAMPASAQVKAIAFEDVAGCWALEAALQAALAVPAYKQAGTQRLLQAWRQQHLDRFQEAMRLLAEPLVQAARDAQEVEGSRSWLREVLSGEARRERQQAGEAAMAQVLLRTEERLVKSAQQLLRLHGLDQALVLPGMRMPQMLPTATAIGQLGAPLAGGAAGLAAGALAGAKIDLLTGGLTMGAGAALGALIGGTGAFGAARWRRGNAGTGAEVVRLSDEQLGTLAEVQLIRYLAIIHAGRLDEPALEAALPGFRSEGVAALASEQDRLREFASRARQQPADEELRAALALALREAAARTLKALYPGRALLLP